MEWNPPAGGPIWLRARAAMWSDCYWVETERKARGTTAPRIIVRRRMHLERRYPVRQLRRIPPHGCFVPDDTEPRPRGGDFAVDRFVRFG